MSDCLTQWRSVRRDAVRDGKHAEDQVSSRDTSHLGQGLIHRATNGAFHSADEAVDEPLNAMRARATVAICRCWREGSSAFNG